MRKKTEIPEPEIEALAEAPVIQETEPKQRRTVYCFVTASDTLGGIAARCGTDCASIIAANRHQYPRIAAGIIEAGWTLTVHAFG